VTPLASVTRITMASYPLGTAVVELATDVAAPPLVVGTGATVDPPPLEHAAGTSTTNEPSTRRRRTGAR
jgi:hypothetical protein